MTGNCGAGKEQCTWTISYSQPSYSKVIGFVSLAMKMGVTQPFAVKRVEGLVSDNLNIFMCLECALIPLSLCVEGSLGSLVF